jgi:uncharacterized protein YifE (UPF0438 family)
LYNNLIEGLKSEEILVYLRKSRADDPTLSVEEVLEKHETILDEWVEGNLDAPINEENKFREVVSGETIADRPEIQKLLKRIESPKIKAILTVEVQRLSRGDLEDAGRLIKLLRYTNTLVITPHKTYDLIDEYDRDMFERELKRGNEFLEYQKKIMNRGRLLSVSQGNFIGSIPPYGYDKVFVTEGKRKSPILSVNEEQADVVRMIFDLYVNQDMGVYLICNRLDELHIKPPKGQYWSAPAIRDMLSNIHYIGKVKWNWRKTVTIVEDSEIIKTRPKSKDGDYLVYDGKHEAIISEELFNAAREKQGRNHRAKPTTKVRNPFAGLIRCRCGRSMTLRFYKTTDGKEKSSPRLICDNQSHCNTGSCLYSEMTELVVNILKQSIADCDIKLKRNTDDSAKVHAKLIKSLEKKLSDLQAKELSQWESQSDPDPQKRMPQHIFQMLNAKLLKEKEEIETTLREAYNTMPTPTEYSQRRAKLQDALNALQDENIEAAEKNKLLKTCIERIEYSRERPLRRKGQQKSITNDGVRTHVSPLPTGASWSNPNIELDVRLKV